MIKRLDDASEHARNLKGKIVRFGFELNNKGYNRIAVIVRPSESIEGWLSLHRGEAPEPEAPHNDAAELDEIFGGVPDPDPTNGADAHMREPGADDDQDFPL